MANALSPSRDIKRLIEIMAALRTPGTGCPWDLEQTFETIAPYTIEEAYEVADAIARHDLADLKDELGDLLLQVVYHARLAEEQGAFTFGDVVEAITRKMIRRHPHVFADGAARDAASVKIAWETIKAEERDEKRKDRAASAHAQPVQAAGRDQPQTSFTLANVPAALPALTRAVKLQDEAAKVGFDWPNLKPVLDKLKEEIAEFEEVALEADPRREAPRDQRSAGRSRAAESRAAINEEFGDVLFVMANIARHLKIDPEAALRAANQKFIRRFAYIETRLAERGKVPAQSTLSEMDALWDEAKEVVG
jgi:ATP diphosphatase